MTTSSESEKTAPPRRSAYSRMISVAFVAGAALLGGIVGVSAATGMGACGFHHGMTAGNYSAADVSAHVDHVLKHLYVEIDATDAQKAQITQLVHQPGNALLRMQPRRRPAT